MSLTVLHVAEYLDAEAGSVTGSLRGMCSALGEHDVESHFCAAPAKKGDHSASLEADVAGPDRLGALIGGATVVHIHGWGGELTTSAATMARETGKPYVISPHGGLVPQPLERKSWLDRWRDGRRDKPLVRGASCLTAINAAEQRALSNRFAAQRVTVLPYGLAIDAYRSMATDAVELDSLPEGRILLHLGPIHPQEGLVPLLKAFAELGSDAEGWGVVLAGVDPGGWQAQLEAAVRRKGASDRVSFLRADGIEMHRALLSRASILAATSLHYRCPTSILAAVACEVPVLASTRLTPPGLEKVVRTCEPKRESIRSALVELVNCSDDERRSIATTALSKGREVFDWAVVSGQWASLYHEVAQR